MRPWMLAALVTLVPPTLGHAQPASLSDQTLIMTTGVGEVRRPPDYAEVTFALRGEGANSVAALRALTATQTQVEASLKGERAVVRINTTDLNTQEVRPPECNRSPVVLSTGACSVTGAIATLGYRVRVSPADKSGDVASLMAQLGAIGPRLGIRGVNDDKAMTEQALAAAFADAKSQAAAAAGAAGLKLGPVLRITPEGQSGRFEEIAAVRLAAPPPPLPLPPIAVPVGLTLEPVVKTTRLTVAFALQP